MTYSTDDIQAFLNPDDYYFNGIKNNFSTVATLEDSASTSLVWGSNNTINPNDYLAAVFILPADSVVESSHKSIFLVPSPRLTYSRLVKYFFAIPPSQLVSGVVSNLAECHDCLSLGSGAVVAQGCVIGRNVVIEENVVLHPGTVVGDNVIIQAGAVIGASGFGFTRNSDGGLEHFPHVGNVVLGDNVEVGANTCIDRGALGSTIIGNGSKISNLCQIAHNVHVGKDCLIAGKSQIGGGTTVGDSVYIGPSAIISNKLVIGSRADIKIGSVVVSDVKESASVSGNFALDHRKTLRHSRTLARS
jgi:UDP-3-O-[3-hydroxymyristoyl] glucosamine N-acyltransferase